MQQLGRRIGSVALLSLGILLAIAGQAAADDSWPMDPRGPLAKDIAGLYWLLFVVAVIVLAIVVGGLVYAGIRFRARPGHVAKQFHGHSGLEMLWTVIPTIIVVSFSVLSISHLNYVNASDDAELTIRAKGKQWAWIYTYPNEPAFLTRENKPLQTAEELHIPVGTKVKIELEAADVIHSFWVPALGGKKDAVPGRSTSLWLQADQAGVYKGQCTEFCGTGHADMLIVIVAQSKADYATWAKGAVDDYNRLNGPEVAKGRETFLANACSGCHMVKGTTAAGKVGPDLTNIASRKQIAGVLGPVNAANMTAWLKNPQAVKPGTQMPNLNLSDQTIADITSYLLTLK